jgi:hypothetical protein
MSMAAALSRHHRARRPRRPYQQPIIIEGAECLITPARHPASLTAAPRQQGW